MGNHKYIYIYISADPGLRQGRGGAWDHRRCGTSLSCRKQRRTPTLSATCPSHLQAPAICFSRGSRLPTLTAIYIYIYAPAICFSGGSRLPFARPQTLQTLQTLPQASKATTLTATCPCHLFFRGFKTAVCPPSNAPNPSAGLQGNNSYSYMPLPSVFQGVQDCRLPALKRSKPFRRPPRQQLLQLHAAAICFSGGSRLPLAWL